MAYKIPSKWWLCWGERWWCWKDDFAMNLSLFRQPLSKSTTLDELRGRLDEIAARIMFEPRTLQDCSFPPLVQGDIANVLERWNENRNGYTGMDEIATWAWFVAFVSFLINTLHHSELLDWVWWSWLQNQYIDLGLRCRYRGLLKIPSGRIRDNLTELNPLHAWSPFFSKFPHFETNVQECMKSLKTNIWEFSVDNALDIFHKMLPLMYKYYPEHSPQQ